SFFANAARVAWREARPVTRRRAAPREDPRREDRRHAGGRIRHLGSRYHADIRPRCQWTVPRMDRLERSARRREAGEKFRATPEARVGHLQPDPVADEDEADAQLQRP